MAAAVQGIARLASRDASTFGGHPVDLVNGYRTTGLASGSVALAVTLKPKQWKPLLRWWGRWRRIQAPQTARDLIAAGWQPGPAIGEELRRQRSAAQDRSR